MCQNFQRILIFALLFLLSLLIPRYAVSQTPLSLNVAGQFGHTYDNLDGNILSPSAYLNAGIYKKLSFDLGLRYMFLKCGQDKYTRQLNGHILQPFLGLSLKFGKVALKGGVGIDYSDFVVTTAEEREQQSHTYTRLKPLQETVGATAYGGLTVDVGQNFYLVGNAFLGDELYAMGKWNKSFKFMVGVGYTLR